MVLATGCSRSNEAELAIARADAEAARAEAAKARAEADAVKAALPKPPLAPAGLRVWRDTEAEDFCEWLGIEADCFKFDGGWVDCWVEIDVGGKKTRLEAAAPLHRIATEKNALADPVVGQPSGSFLWIRRLDKQEAWVLPFRFSVKTANGVSSGSSTPRLADGPPQPSEKGEERLVSGDAEVLLKGDEVVTLVTLFTDGEKDGEITRTAKLQCRALK
ncbi:MAG: hypothetical protein KJ000_00395 [Pirellulaceae bacterium]|nr:hypothetical protein [Pirellulaceae bacterium]